MAADRFWPSASPPSPADIPVLGRRDDPKNGNCCCPDSHYPRNVGEVGKRDNKDKDVNQAKPAGHSTLRLTDPTAYLHVCPLSGQFGTHARCLKVAALRHVWLVPLGPLPMLGQQRA
jgi:hypothetical protein